MGGVRLGSGLWVAIWPSGSCLSSGFQPISCALDKVRLRTRPAIRAGGPIYSQDVPPEPAYGIPPALSQLCAPAVASDGSIESSAGKIKRQAGLSEAGFCARRSGARHPRSRTMPKVSERPQERPKAPGRAPPAHETPNPTSPRSATGDAPCKFEARFVDTAPGWGFESTVGQRTPSPPCGWQLRPVIVKRGRRWTVPSFP